MQKCTQNPKSKTDLFLTTNFFENLSAYVEINPKMNAVEDRLDTIIQQGLDLLPQMRGISNKYLSLLNYGVSINQE